MEEQDRRGYERERERGWVTQSTDIKCFSHTWTTSSSYILPIQSNSLQQPEGFSYWSLAYVYALRRVISSIILFSFETLAMDQVRKLGLELLVLMLLAKWIPYTLSYTELFAVCLSYIMEESVIYRVRPTYSVPLVLSHNKVSNTFYNFCNTFNI